MQLSFRESDFDSFILIGDKLLIKPRSAENRTKAGLFLPPGIEEKEEIRSGYVIRVGPGIPVPFLGDAEEPWKEKRDEARYIPLQAKPGDLAIYLQKSGYEIVFNNERYAILPHSAILMLIRDPDMV